MAVSQLSAAAREALPAVRRPAAPSAGGRPASGSQPVADANGRAGVNRSVSMPGPPPPLALPPVRPRLPASVLSLTGPLQKHDRGLDGELLGLTSVDGASGGGSVVACNLAVWQIKP